MTDELILDIGTFFSASKNRSYREQVISTFSTYVNFLQDNGLTTRTVLTERAVSQDTKLRKSDLTEEGLEFVRNVEQRWLKSLDRGTSGDDTTMLERELAKIRQTKS